MGREVSLALKKNNQLLTIHAYMYTVNFIYIVIDYLSVVEKKKYCNVFTNKTYLIFSTN